jgi:DNA-binding NarL/FixJ family response regulator
MQGKLLLADKNTLIVEAFSKLLEHDFDIVATVTDGLALLEKAAQLKPDVVILDLDLPQLSGMAAGKELRHTLPRTKFIVVTASEDFECASQSMRQWASAYLLKKSTSAELIRAIHDVLKGSRYVTPYVARRLLESFINDPNAEHEPSMTIRQKQVLQLLAEGKSMKEVAAALAITKRTVAYHKYEIMRLHSLQSMTDIVMFAIKERILPVPAQMSF